MNYNPKERYFLKNWKRLSIKERNALSHNVSFFNISCDTSCTLSVPFLKEYEDRIMWDKYSMFGIITEDILLNFHHKLILSSVFLRNIYSEDFILKNIFLLKNIIPLILTTQCLSEDTIIRLKTFHELAC